MVTTERATTLLLVATSVSVGLARMGLTAIYSATNFALDQMYRIAMETEYAV